MAASTRIKATNIIFSIDSVDYACDANMVSLTPEDAPGAVQSFCAVEADQEWKLQIDGVMSGEDTSLYQILLTNYGEELAFKVCPQGNTTATADAPNYSGTIVVDKLVPISLTANEFATFSVTYTVKNTGLNVASNLFYGLTKHVA